MRTFIRAALVSLITVAMFVGPVSAATNQATMVAQATQTGTVSGHVANDSGNNVAGANVIIDGAGQHQTTTTDDAGNFSAALPPGLYNITVVKAGFQSGSSDVTVPAGGLVNATVSLTTASLSNLGVIGRTSSLNSSANQAKFNISSTPTNIVTQTQILERNTQDLTPVLNEVPGVTIPHSTSNPNQGFVVRGLRYETKVTLDGHPVSGGTGGLFLTNYAQAAIFGSVDVVKGAGLTGPIAGESGVGTVNLRTPDFTAKDSAFIQGGVDQYNGSFFTAFADINIGPKLSLVLGRAFSGYRGPTYGLQEPNALSPPNVNNYTFTPPYLTNTLVNFVTDFSNTYSLNAELAKLRYKFSDATSLSFEFLGLQGRFDPQGGAYGQFAGFSTIPQCLNGSTAGTVASCGVTSTYNQPSIQPLAGSTSFPLYAYFPSSDVRQNQPNFNADFKTTFKNDTILFRPYTAAINRLIDGTQENSIPGNGGGWSQVTNAANCQVNYVAPVAAGGAGNLAAGGAMGPCFAAGVQPIAAYVGADTSPRIYATTGTAPVCTATTPCYTTSTSVNNANQAGYGSPYTTLEIDKLFGYTFQYIHPVGANTYSLSFDHYFDDTTTYVNDASPLAAGCTFTIGSGVSNTPGFVGNQTGTGCPLPTLHPTPVSVPETFASVSSLALTGQFQLTPKLEFDAGLYFTQYLINGQQENPAILAALTPIYGAAPNPTGAPGRTGAIPYVPSGFQNSASHIDPHFGLLYRPIRDLAIRFTAGSSLSIPYAALVSGIPSYQQGSASTTVQTPNPLLGPEEVVTLDLGADYRAKDGTVISGDIYNTVVHNPWLTTKSLICFCTLPGLETTSATFSSLTLNGAQQYAQGIELAVTNEPAMGLGYRVNTSFERNYYLGTPAALFVNSPQTFYNGAQLASNGSSITSVPYSKGYAEVQYAGPKHGLIRIGADYEGPNNSYNAPAFWIFDAGAAINLGWQDVMFGMSVENLMNTNFNALYARGVEFQGVSPVQAVGAPNGYAYPKSLINTGLVAPSPFTMRFTLTKKF